MLQRILEWVFGPAHVPTEVRVVKKVRLEQSVLNDLRRRVGGTCVVTTQTTDHMAGYQLGINHVLNVLQEGFTITD